MNKLKPLLPYFRPYRPALISGILCILATAVAALLAPLIIGNAIDAMQESISRQALLVYGALLIAVTCVQGVFQFAQRKILVTMSRNIERDLRDRFFHHLAMLDRTFLQGHETGDLMARATNDLEAVRQLCGPAIMYSTNTVFTATGALFFMLDIHLGLTLLALATLPLASVVMRIFGQRIHVLFRQVQESYGDLSTKVQENLSGARIVRAYAQEDAEEAQFDTLSRSYVQRNKDLIRWNASFSPLLQSVIGLGFVAVLWYGGYLMIEGAITVGGFVTFNLFLGRLAWPMIAIGWVINLAQRGTASLGRIQQLLDTDPAIRDEPPLVDVEGIAGAFRLQELSFAYEKSPTPVLAGIDLDFEAGTTVAVVGRTGAGKSTLVSLIPRLFDPPPGTLFVDGVDIRHLPLATLRGAIAMVPQETFLFSATIRDNIRFGKPNASDEEVRSAASTAGLDRDLEGFPQGLDTLVGERGITLSGGQKQRVALARALLRDPQILILDDCLSAVDAETEEKILGNLRTVFPGRTVFLVSHRISAVKTADVILVLDDGRIQEQGTHQELLAHGGAYADLHQRQQLEEALAVV